MERSRSPTLERRRSPNKREISKKKVGGSPSSQNTGRYRNDHSFNGHERARETKRVSTLDEDIAKLKWGVAKHVKFCIDFSHHKIHDKDEYTRTAKMLTYNFLTLIKDSYEAYNGTLDGISLTGDHKAFIQIQVEMHFDPKSSAIYKQLVTIEDKTVNLEKKCADININNICQRHRGGILLHLSEEVLRDSLKQANRLNEEMQKLLESLDGVILLADQHGNIYF